MMYLVTIPETLEAMFDRVLQEMKSNGVAAKSGAGAVTYRFPDPTSRALAVDALRADLNSILDNSYLELDV